MTQVSDKEQRARLGSLYRIAVTLTDDPDRAARLLDATAARIQGDASFHGLPQREWFTRVVATILDIHYENRTEGPSDIPPSKEISPVVSSQRDARKAAYLIRPIVSERLPIVWASMSQRDRTMLVLAEVEGLGRKELGVVTGTTPEEAEAGVQEARERLSAAIFEELTPREQILARNVLTEQHLAEMLRSYVREDVGRTTSSVPDAVAKRLLASLGPTESQSLPTASSTESRAPAASRRGLVTALRYVLLATAIVVLIGLVGYVASQYFEQAPETNLITLSAERASDISPIIHTDQLDEAERFIYEQHGTRLILPSIDRAVLLGAALTQVTPGIEVPTFLYEEHSGDTIALYAYNYRLLDRHGDRLQLTSDVLQQIEDDTHYDIHALSARQVLVWRHRSTIYVAVTQNDATDLKNRIIMPS